MAETKAAVKKRKANSSRSKSNASTASSKAKKTRSTKARKRPASKSRPAASKAKTSASKPAASKPQAVLETIEETAKDAGGKVASVASKAKVPLLAGGAALAGAAGGLALGARQAAHHKSRIGNVSSKDLTKAARKVGEVGAQVGEVALEVRRARESTNGHGKAHRSPIEVVLQGLTSRGPRG
jgi:hypothetical protein